MLSMSGHEHAGWTPLEERLRLIPPRPMVSRDNRSLYRPRMDTAGRAPKANPSKANGRFDCEFCSSETKSRSSSKIFPNNVVK
ncbi:hypothetical protein Bhyg_13446 [Pseudolycoriella hygida]|uniref:Uncharacterized protein n=1 Tax=Pseudolycoriella hygida TaxID=35572 RepID=A0A9Q0MMV6_9DIPT|nr:hypothetical protein Bhyg_13446 [Pseudolycoriella hygida]